MFVKVIGNWKAYKSKDLPAVIDIDLCGNALIKTVDYLIGNLKEKFGNK